MTLTGCGLLAFLLALIAACVGVGGDGAVEGKVYFGGGEVELPVGAVVTVQLQDTSLQDAAAVTLGEHVIKGARRLPVRFRIPYDADRVEEWREYSLQATVEHGGRLLYINDTVHLVLTNGNPEDLDVEVIRVR